MKTYCKKIKDKKKDITTDDIEELKFQKQYLISEISKLKSKIMHLQEQYRRSILLPQSGPQILAQLDQEYSEKLAIIKHQQAQINELLQSDSISQQEELQEESKILYAEKKRLDDLVSKGKCELKRIQDELDKTYKEYGKGRLENEIHNQKVLEERLHKTEELKVKLESKLKKINEQKQESIPDNLLRLKTELAKIEKSTAAMKEKMKKAEARHQERLHNMKIDAIQYSE